MVAVPDLMAAFEQGAVDLETVKAVQLAVIAHCELMGDRMAILDPPPQLSAQDAVKWRRIEAGYDSKFAALYYPWIKVLDPVSGSNRFIPPSGHIAGVWARNDNERGVHKAPANEVVRGAVELQTQLTRTEQELLNPIGVNAIRSFPGRGVRVWGARTLSSDPAWRYINVRRLFNYLEKSILTATQFAVFEPNDPALWGKLTRSISSFLIGEWRKGALFGRTRRRGVLREVRRRDEPGRRHRRGPGHLPDRRRAREARGVRGVPALAVLGRHEPRHRMTDAPQPLGA